MHPRNARFFVPWLMLFGLLLPAAGGAAQLTDAMSSTDFPDYRVGPGGAMYLIRHDAGVDSGALLLRAFNTASAVIIDDTQVNAGGTGSASTRPVIAIDASRRLFVAWENRADNEVYLLRLEPLLDDLDGSPADPAVIKTLADTQISNPADGQPARNPAMAIDGSGNLHIVWEGGAGAPVQYVKVDPDGLLLNGPVMLGGNGSGNDLPDIAIDSVGHVHVVYTHAGTTAANEVYYAMLDGGTGAVRIAPTLLSADDGLRAGNATVSVNLTDDRVYVVYKQATSLAGSGDERIYLTALQPSADDQDGSAALLTTLRLHETAVSGIAQFSWQVFSRIGYDRRVHVIAMDFDDTTCPSGANYAISNTHVTYDGRIITTENLTNTGVALTCNPQARLAPRSDRVVWTDSRTGNTEIFSAGFSRADAGSSGFTCSLGNPDATAARAGELWLLLGFIAVLGGLRARRAPRRSRLSHPG
jgi:hypothetical protein